MSSILSISFAAKAFLFMLFSVLEIPVAIGPPDIKIIGKCPFRSAPIINPGTILSQVPMQIAASNTLCERPTAVDKAMVSLENKDNSIPGSPWVIRPCNV